MTVGAYWVAFVLSAAGAWIVPPVCAYAMTAWLRAHPQKDLS